MIPTESPARIPKIPERGNLCSGEARLKSNDRAGVQVCAPDRTACDSRTRVRKVETTALFATE
jgi:hypothetical protein